MNVYVAMAKQNSYLEYDELVSTELGTARDFLSRCLTADDLDDGKRSALELAIGQIDIAQSATEASMRLIINLDVDTIPEPSVD